MPSQDSGLLLNVFDSFRPYIQELWKDLNFGFCRNKIDIENFQCSNNSFGTQLADQFTIVLPYAGSYLRWEVLFDAIHPWFAPDFRFDDENFLSDVSTEFIDEYIPSLANWNADDPKALSCVITELMNLYRKYQKELLRSDENSRAYFEYTTLIGASTDDDDIEILVKRRDAVNFMIKLNIDCGQLPTLFSEDFEIFENPGGECAVLLVKYPNPGKADLIMSPLLSRVVGDMPLPPINQDAVLMDYVPEATIQINRKIATVIQDKQQIQEVLAEFIVKYESSIIEHNGKTASFLIAVNDFYCLLHIEIEVLFPKRKPSLILESVYHLIDGKPCSKSLSSFPKEDLPSYIIAQVKLFQEECNELF